MRLRFYHLPLGLNVSCCIKAMYALTENLPKLALGSFFCPVMTIRRKARVTPLCLRSKKTTSVPSGLPGEECSSGWTTRVTRPSSTSRR